MYENTAYVWSLEICGFCKQVIRTDLNIPFVSERADVQYLYIVFLVNYEKI